MCRSSECLHKKVAYKHEGKKEHPDPANDLVHKCLVSGDLVIGVGVLDVGEEDLLIPNLVIPSFLIILQSLPAKMLQDLHETTFVRSADAVLDM